jgi:hypothetical protein
VTLSLEQITHLLNGLKSLPPLRKQELTFMEIAGYPHFENVCSNILQFYLQPSNEHGFGSLLLDSLFTLINEEVVIDGQNIDVRREESTPENNRIDLIIESDDFVFGIENKIFAGLYNPLKDYEKHLESICNGRKVYKLVLSLRPLKVSTEKLYGFKPITYQLLFEQVIANIGSYFLTGREPHTIFFRDFIQTIQNLQEANSMDQQRLSFFHDNKQDLAILLKEVDVLRKDMRKKLTNLKLIIDKDLSQLPYSNDTDRGFWRNSSLRDILWCSFKISNLLWLHVEVEITPSGWWMRFGNRSGGISKVEELLKSREINYEINHNKKRLVYKSETHILPYNSSPEDSAKWVLDMLKRLTAS